MLRADSVSLLDFIGHRVSKIKTKSSPEEEWYWVPTDCNLDDMGTRPTVQPEEMGEDSDYQNGIEWMRRPVEEWPVKKTVTPPPGGVQEGHGAGCAQGSGHCRDGGGAGGGDRQLAAIPPSGQFPD